MKHITYARIVEERDQYPVENSHLGFEMPDTSPITLEEVQHHIERTLSEIVVVVEVSKNSSSAIDRMILLILSIL